MRKLIMWNMVTLDGFFEGAQRWDLDFHSAGWGEELQRFSNEQMGTADLLLFGRVTYEGMAQYWPTARGETAERMNGMQKVVFSRTLTSADWANSRLVSTDAAEEVARLKEEPGKDILVFGSADLMNTLVEHDLVDEYRLMIFPVVLGSGQRLFGDGVEETVLELVGTETFDTGVVVLSYRPADKKAEE